VLSELDPERRGRLLALLRDAGQSVITTADPSLVPGLDEPSITRVAVADGAVMEVPRGDGGAREAA
jgi:DNA replication and repair protein RecF